jgi:acyl-CoA hydrolase
MKAKPVRESCSEMIEFVLPQDANYFGNLLGGKVMHWVDLAGVLAAQRHCRKPVVTASMDALDFHSPIKMGQLAVFRSCVTYVSRTSMEVKVDVFSEDPLTGRRAQTSTAYLTYVALDKHGKPAPVPKVHPETPGERKEFESGRKRREMRLLRLHQGFNKG